HVVVHVDRDIPRVDSESRLVHAHEARQADGHSLDDALAPVIPVARGPLPQTGILVLRVDVIRRVGYVAAVLDHVHLAPVPGVRRLPEIAPDRFSVQIARMRLVDGVLQRVPPVALSKNDPCPAEEGLADQLLWDTVLDWRRLHLSHVDPDPSKPLRDRIRPEPDLAANRIGR